MGVLDSLAGTVGRLLTTFGKEITVRNFTDSYSPATGANTKTSNGIGQNVTIRALVEDYPARDTRGGQSGGDGVVRGDRKVTFAANAVSIAPTTETVVLIDSVQYAVLKVDTQYGTDNALIYVLQCRR